MESWYVAMVLNQCPACGEANLFDGFMTLHETCPHCRVRFERWPGSWTGPTVGGYGVGALVGMALFFLLYKTDNLFPYVEWVIGIVACMVVLVVYRFVKAAWIGLMYDWGYVYADPEAKPDVTAT